MAINETWLRNGEELRAPMPAGYRLRHVPRPAGVRARGGGVGFYIREGIHSRQINTPGDSSVEQMWLSVTLSGIRVAIGTAYRPPWLGVDIFIDALTESVTLLSTFDHIMLVGDFSINLLVSNDPNTTRLATFLQSLNLIQYVTVPTHFTDHSQTLIDLICSTTNISNISVDYIPELSSHAFISFNLRISKPKARPRWITYRPLKDIDFNEFNNLVNTISWERLLRQDVNDAVLSFNAYVLHVFDIYAPVVKSYVKHQSYPWITPTIKEMMKIRDDAHAKCRLTGHETDIIYYKEMKSLTKKALFAEKSAYFHHNVNKNSKDSKKIWKNIKSNVVNFKNSHQSLPPNINDPDEINNHFLSVPGNNNIPISDLTYYEHHRFSCANFSLKTVDETTVLKIILDISTNTQGADGITRDMILLTLPRTLGVITSIVNKSLQSGIFPDVWKEAVVRPIPKNNNPKELKDLRPISILPFMSKILEKVVCLQLTEYLDGNNILPQKQSGFRGGRSTATALLDVVDDILAGQDAGLGSILVLLDFSRAFDAINHNLLLSKLAFYGFDSKAVQWFSSYFNGRTQHVEICNGSGVKTRSKAAALKRGVPQGSILGPILFILYTTELASLIKNCNYHMYADDLQIYLSFKPINTLIAVRNINEDLDHITSWAYKNCLVLNPQKSKFLILGSMIQINTINSFNPVVEVGGEIIEKVTEARNLGVLMDNQLRFKSHVVETVKNCFYRLKILYKVRDYLDVNVRVKLCDSLILSKLNYADTVMGECLFVYTKRLIQRVQNACARFCFTIPPRAHVTPFLNQGKLMNMTSRRSLHFATLLFGIVQTKSPPYLYEKLSFSQRRIRFASRLICPRHNTAAFRGSFRYSATKCWNNIPPPLRNCHSSTSFKRKYKKYLLDIQGMVAT